MGISDFDRFVQDVAGIADGDFATGFKMLGFVLYVSRYGADRFLSGSLVSPRTYYRWLDTVKAAGWNSVLAEVRLGQALREYATGVNAEPEQLRTRIVGRLDEVLG